MKKVNYNKEWNREEEWIESIPEHDKWYNVNAHNTLAPQERVLLQQVDKNTKALDIGCCFGRLMRLFPNAFGVDVSENMLERNPYKNRIKLMDATNGLDFDDKTFDNVFIFRVLMHLRGKNIDNVLLESSRVLKDGGHIYTDILKHQEAQWLLRRIYWKIRGIITPITALSLTKGKMIKILTRLNFEYEILDVGKNELMFKIKKK